MSEPKPMSPLEKIKALKAEAEAKKSREAQEAAERAAKEQNEQQEKLLEARKKFGEAQKLVDECTATYNETAEEMKGIEDTELLGQISAIVEESRAAKESAEAALRAASDALENLERLESNNAPTSTPESPVQRNPENKEGEPDFLHYESRVDNAFHLSVFNKEDDFSKVLRGEPLNLQFPEDAARIVGEINKLRREPHTRNQERESLKKDVEQYLSVNGLSTIYKEVDAAKTRTEKEAVLNKINKVVAQIDGYLIKMFTLTKGGESNTPNYVGPDSDNYEYVQRNTRLYDLPDYHKPNMSPINRDQMGKLEIILGNLKDEAKKIRESIT